MNIFFLHANVYRSVECHVDKHVLSANREVSQMLAYPFRLYLDRDYKHMHLYHPMSVWVRESLANWHWTLSYLHAAHCEWQYRWSHWQSEIHGSVTTLLRLLDRYDVADVIDDHDAELTQPPQCMGKYSHCRDPDNVVRGYRCYYRAAKTHLFKWTARNKPQWL